MKKTYKSSLLALSVLASFTSCSESESLQQANLSKDKITFHTTLDNNSWKPLSPASSSRAAIAAATDKGPIVVPTPFGKPLYLHPVVQDGIHIWSKEGKPITRSGAPLEDVEHERVAQTRGTMMNKIGDYGSFGVTAIYKEGENNVLLLDNAEAEKTDGEFWGFTNNSNAKWPIGSTVSFHAYAPHSSADKSQLTYGVDKDNVQTQITYTASTTKEGIINQPDLILATNAGSRQSADPDKAVSLSFQHALTAVTFALDKSFYNKYKLRIDSLVLKGIPNKGTCKLSLSATDDVPSVTWSMDNGTGHYRFNLSGALQTPGEDLVLTSGNQTLMMIPQTLPESAEVILYLSGDGHHGGIIVSLKDQKWEAGKSIIYKISGSPDELNPELKIVYPDTWTAHSFPKTSFQKNDKIGLYVINAEGNLEVKNEMLTYYKRYDSDGYTWVLDNVDNVQLPPGYRYFAYYPYSASMPDVDRTALTASDFFKTKISSLADNVVADQSNEGTFLAQDFQMAKGIIGPDAGSIVFNMEHQVGLAVLDLKSKEILETRQFKNNNYMYYYGQGTTEPVEGTDYTCVGNKLTFTPSDQFVDNKPYHVKDNKYLQVIPLGKTMQFKADNKTGTKVESWGYDQAISLSPTRNNPVVRANIECGVPFTKIERLYLSQREAVEEFDIPEVTEYTLSCWGATGTSLNNGTVSPAGFAKASWTPAASDKKLYICVGNRSGYNNGKSSGYNPNGGWGGGASHIATSLQGNGETYNYKNNINDLLMVSGGSGCASFANASKPSGYGGGESGGTGRTTSSWDSTVRPQGGTQTGPGRNTPSNATLKQPSAFGIGGYALKDNIAVQGGSGFYGGGGGFNTHNAGGGSGYMNTKRVNQQTFLGGNEVNKQDSHPDPNKLGACRITWTYHRPNTLK